MFDVGHDDSARALHPFSGNGRHEASARPRLGSGSTQPPALAGFFSSPDELATKVSAAVVRALQLGTTPVDVEREHRLMKEWRQGASRANRVRARHALINMGSPRYAAEIKDRLFEAKDAEGNSYLNGGAAHAQRE